MCLAILSDTECRRRNGALSMVEKKRLYFSVVSNIISTQREDHFEIGAKAFFYLIAETTSTDDFFLPSQATQTQTQTANEYQSTLLDFQRQVIFFQANSLLIVFSNIF